MRVAIAQMAASRNLEANLLKMEEFAKEAADRGARWIAFPEMAYFIGPEEESRAVAARWPELLTIFQGWAKSLKIEILPGTLREPFGGRFRNSLPYLGTGGDVLAIYRKIFLFKGQLSDRDYDEGKNFSPGTEVVVVQRPWGNVGLAICFDLRFPELFRALKKRGASVFVVPSAFTAPTGTAHWQILVRARAIENGCFLIAPGLSGKCGDDRETYGHSMVIAPWGEVLADLGTGEKLEVLDLPLQALEEGRKRVDAWSCRRDDLFPIG